MANQVVAGPAHTDRIEGLYARARAAVSPEARASCLEDLESALDKASGPVDRGRLLLCRARLYANRWQTHDVLQDALGALALFEEAEEQSLALDAASVAAGFASRSGELSLAAELAAKCLIGIGAVTDDRLVAEVANRMGIFCYSFLDYDRAVQQFEEALFAAERAGDRYLTCRQLHNIADALLVAVRANSISRWAIPGLHSSQDHERLERSAQVLNRLLAEVSPDMQLSLSAHRMQAELLLETGHPQEALQVIENASPERAAAEDPLIAAFSAVESRCLCALGRREEAIEAAERAVEMAESGGDDLELMLNLEQRLAARRTGGDLEGALADSLQVAERIWAIHKRQTAQLVEQVWVRVALEHESRQLKESAAAAARSAEEDVLTGTGNRRLLERFLARTGEVPATLSLVMADIDHFKEINDAFGHELGDSVLRSIGALFTAGTRSGQIVARFGGEEFVFALPGADLAAAARFAERTRMKVAFYPWTSIAPLLKVTISLGVASGRSEEWRSVLSAADGALYLAKRLGRNRVEHQRATTAVQKLTRCLN